MTDLKKMSNEAINERIQLADASQKQLCAEIARSEDGDFGLGLFDVLQEMYNAGYARGSAPSEGMKPASQSPQNVEAVAKRMWETYYKPLGVYDSWEEVGKADKDIHLLTVERVLNSLAIPASTAQPAAAPSLEECARKMAEAYGWGWEHMSDAAKLTFTKMAKAALDTLQAHFAGTGEPL